MKNIMLCENLYDNIDALYTMFKDMEYKEGSFGSEISDFYFITQGLDERLKAYTHDEIEIQANTGTFRKPNQIIHVEPFYQHCLWVCIVALEDTKLTIWEQDDVRLLYHVPQEQLNDFITQNCNDQSKWTPTKQLNIKKNEFVFIRPWLWYSLEENKLVQVFLLNRRIENKEEDV